MYELEEIIKEITRHAERGVSVGPEVMRRWVNQLKGAEEAIGYEMQEMMERSHE